MASEHAEELPAHEGSDMDNCSTQSDPDVNSRKRSRLGGKNRRGGPVSSLPRDVVDAMILLRVRKERDFLLAADGRSKQGRGRVWEDMAQQLRSEFADREDVSLEHLTGRSLGRRWSYVEKRWKVRNAAS